MRAICYQHNIETNEDGKEYYSIIKDLIESDIVQSMDKFDHHYNTTCLQHSINVSYHSYTICKKLHLDYRAGARGGLLHDLFLYDWTTYKPKAGEALHGFTHALKAYKNAREYFDINEKEGDIILKHMWPLTLSLPRYKESHIIVWVDKYCSILEILSHFVPTIKMAKN